MKKQVFNPYLPGWEYIPDGEPYVFGDRVYIYGSHDRFNGEKFCMNDYVCWSAPVDDLADWRYDGVIYKKTDDPMYPDGDHCLFAPDVQLGLDGRYYLYYAFDDSGVISVAVCDSPVGKYKYYGTVKTAEGHIVGSKTGDINQFDPGVFIDDDERIFLYSGFSPKVDLNDPVIKAYAEEMRKRAEATGEQPPMGRKKLEGAYVFELERDMVTVKRGPELMIRGFMSGSEPGFEGHEFFEASSMRKIGGKYYFIYSSVNSHELCYAVSDRPDGGFKYGGTIVSIGDVFLDGRAPVDALNYLGNTHGSLVEIKGQWYVFYHRQTNRHQYSRQACAEPVALGADGSIRQVEITSCGLNGGALAGKGSYPARIACTLMSKEGAANSHLRRPVQDQSAAVDYPFFTQDGADREDSNDQHIANFGQGAVAGIKYFEFAGAKNISVRIRGGAHGKIIVSTGLLGSPSSGDLRHGAMAAEIEIEPCESWADFSAPLTVQNGVYPLYFSFEGSGKFDFIEFTLE